MLDGFEEIKIATAYTYEGQKLESFPGNIEILAKVEVTYETLPGWKQQTAGTKKWEDLPENARKSVEFIEQFVGVHIKYIGTGKFLSWCRK